MTSPQHSKLETEPECQEQRFANSRCSITAVEAGDSVIGSCREVWLLWCLSWLPRESVHIRPSEHTKSPSIEIFHPASWPEVAFQKTKPIHLWWGGGWWWQGVNSTLKRKRRLSSVLIHSSWVLSTLQNRIQLIFQVFNETCSHHDFSCHHWFEF